MKAVVTIGSLVVALVGCGFNSALTTGGSGDAPINAPEAGIASDAGTDAHADAHVDAHPDARPDAPPDAPPDARACFGVGQPNGLFHICLTASPPSTYTMVATAGSNFDTGTDAHCSSEDTTECLLVADAITIDTAINVTGTKPLVVLATGTLTITATGSLDASSHVVGNILGAGANGAPCGTIVAAKSSTGGGGGGAGGGFGGLGAAGASGDTTAITGGVPAAAAEVPASVRAGCPGSIGGTGAKVTGTATAGGGPGNGGGAIYLIAGTSVIIHGNVSANGAGGVHGANDSGAGGGGAGGLIGLEAPTITIDAAVLVSANAGGGGGGGDDTGGAGKDGSDGAAGSTQAPGGAGSTVGGGGGGAGGAGTTAGTESGTAGTATGAGGGGGGGGVGVIWVHGTATGGMLSPPASTH